MNLRDLRYVVALADLKHFGRAAALCNVSQPTLSTQLKNLEAQLGVQLFERDSKLVTVTQAGAEIVARARAIVSDADAIVAMANSRQDILGTPFRLGVISTLCPYFLPWFIPAFRETFPGARLAIEEDLTAELMQRMANRQLDAVIAALPLHDDTIETRALFDEPFWFACHKDHPLAHKRKISGADLQAKDILLLTEGHCLRDQALAVCQAPSPAGGSDYRATSLSTLRQMVQGNLGTTLLPALAAQALEPDIMIIPLATPVSRTIAAAWRKGSSRTGDVQALIALIRKNLPQGVKAVR